MAGDPELEDPCQEALSLVLPDIRDAAFGKHRRRKRNDWAVGMSQYLVDHAVARDSSEGGCAMCSENKKIGLLGAALVEQFFSRITGYDDGLDGNTLAQFQRNEAEEVRFDVFHGAACKNLYAVLRPNDVLEDQARVVLEG